jgi:hypothetical protein
MLTALSFRSAHFTAIAACVLLSACAPSSRPEPAPPADATGSVDAGSASRPRVDATSPLTSAEPAPPPDAGPPAPVASAEPLKVKLKIVTIGMHVAGGPFDEPTKEPFKKAVEPHFPAIAQCWGRHVTRPPKQADVGVDLLIEAAGGHPKVSNPRSTFDKGDAEGFVPCVIGVFESVDFPKLDRGRTGVSYSLRFTP